MTTTAILVAAIWAGAGSGTTPQPPGRDLFGTRRERAGEGTSQATELAGEVTLSGGERIRGVLSFGAGRSLELYDPTGKVWHRLQLGQIARIDAAVRSEEFEKEWRWKENGSDEKVLTGRGYPRRWLDHTVVLVTGERLTGHIIGAALYATIPPEAQPQQSTKPKAEPAAPAAPAKRRFILRQYERGELGTTLADLVYVSSVVVAPAPGAPPAKPDAPPVPAP